MDKGVYPYPLLIEWRKECCQYSLVLAESWGAITLWVSASFEGVPCSYTPCPLPSVTFVSKLWRKSRVWAVSVALITRTSISISYFWLIEWNFSVMNSMAALLSFFRPVNSGNWSLRGCRLIFSSKRSNLVNSKIIGIDLNQERLNIESKRRRLSSSWF